MGAEAGSDILRLLRVEFARPPRWPALLLWTSAAAVFVAASWVVFRDVQAWQALSAGRARTEALQERLDATRATDAARAASAAEAPPYAADAQRWMALARVDGTGVLRAVESAQVTGVKVIAIDVDAENRRVELEAEVTSAEVAASYLQALNAGADRPAWALVRLQAQGLTESALFRGQLR